MRVSYLLLLLFTTVSKLQAQDSSAHPINLGLVYPLSVYGKNAANQTDRVSVFAIAGVSKSTTAVAIAGVSNVIKQVGTGVQVAGFSNHIGTTWHSATVAGFMNQVKSHGDGAMVAGFMNSSVSFRGIQVAGFANFVKKEVYGSQVAGFMNVAKLNSTVQAAGFLNSGSKANVQIAGFCNNADEASVQVAGFINKAHKVKGVQVAGFINIADSSDYPIGIINIVKGGERQISVSIDETATVIAAFKSGGRYLYGILGAGYNVKESESLYALQAGVGANVFSLPVARLRVEALSTMMTSFKGDYYNRISLNVFPSVHVGKRIEIFGGPTFNWLFTENGLGIDLRKHYLWSETYKHDRFRALYVGVSGGVAVKI
ncbi:hypothetical protein DVR12_21595 [Chitinophaga silvatica]|uniref:Uncharacterized protein n=1 Tax=Chitinophaga silvatica TaxID=2282649 RepID=A0A3E1Y4U6_9BACT|nr:hypothetical protein [Chitinophaga silvatica]RFS19701.1 hypothetical protein DVR12_21595 [Chitinophaga silvatica]